MRHSQGYLCVLPFLAILAPFAGCGGPDETSTAQSSTGMSETVDGGTDLASAAGADATCAA